MADNKKKVKKDRTRVAAEQPYEVYYFRKKHNLTTEKAIEIIKKAKNSRERANKLAEESKGK